MNEEDREYFDVIFGFVNEEYGSSFNNEDRRRIAKTIYMKSMQPNGLKVLANEVRGKTGPFRRVIDKLVGLNGFVINEH